MDNREKLASIAKSLRYIADSTDQFLAHGLPVNRELLLGTVGSILDGLTIVAMANSASLREMVQATQCVLENSKFKPTNEELARRLGVASTVLLKSALTDYEGQLRPGTRDIIKQLLNDQLKPEQPTDPEPSMTGIHMKEFDSANEIMELIARLMEKPADPNIN